MWTVATNNRNGFGSYSPPPRVLRRVRSIAVEGPWSKDLKREYLDQRCNGVTIYGGDASYDYIADLPRLERVLVDHRGLRDDSAIFDVRSLKVLEIYKGGRRKPLPVNKLTQLVET